MASRRTFLDNCLAGSGEALTKNKKLNFLRVSERCGSGSHRISVEQNLGIHMDQEDGQNMEPFNVQATDLSQPSPVVQEQIHIPINPVDSVVHNSQSLSRGKSIEK